MGVSSLNGLGVLVGQTVLAAVVIYAAVLLLARWSGVRSFAELAPFDVAVTIALGSIIASATVANPPLPLRALVAVATLYTLQLFVSRLRRRYRGVEWVTDNRPILLMADGGRQLTENMKTARVSEDDLRSHLRAANVTDRSRVKAVVMEGTGQIQVMYGEPPKDPIDPWLMENVRGAQGEVSTQSADSDSDSGLSSASD